MISLECRECGARLRVSNDKAGRRGRCPRCKSVLTIPHPAGRAEESAEGPAEDGGGGFAGLVSGPTAYRSHGPTSGAAGREARLGEAACPSCHQALGEGAVICPQCGIKLPSGRPILMTQYMDESDLRVKVENVIRPISWLIGIGVYPAYSEARGNARPFVTWAILGLTVLISFWFLGIEWSGSDAMHRHKMLMLWPDAKDPDPEHILAMYSLTSYGDSEAFAEAFEREGGELGAARFGFHRLFSIAREDYELVSRVHASLGVEDRSIGSHRWYQLITNAFLHGGILHLAGNMLFLWVLGSRINAAVGNSLTVPIYLLLAIIASAAHLASASTAEPIPALGASGAVMGVAGMYAVLFPVHKIHMVGWLRWGLFGGFRLSLGVKPIPGILVVCAYIALDVLWLSVGVETGTAHWAHIGGFLGGAGVALALLIGRVVYTGGDLLSVTLGRYAWAILGTPAERWKHPNLVARILVR